MRQTVGTAASGTFAAGCPAIAQPPHRARKHSRQDSNLQHAVLETDALPLELPEYKSRPWNRTSRVYTHAPRSKLRSGGHIKTAPVRRRGCWLAHILSGNVKRAKPSTCKQKRRKMPRRDTFRRLRGKRLTAFGGSAYTNSITSHM